MQTEQTKPTGQEAMVERILNESAPDTSPEKEKPDHEIQKMKWSEVCKYDTYEEALARKTILTDEEFTIKIRWRRDGYSVMLGAPLKKAKPKAEVNNEDKKRNMHRNDRKAKRSAKKRKQK